MIAAMMLMSMGAFAQEAGKLAVGVTFSDYLASDSRILIGAKGQYSITDNFRAEVDFKFAPKKDHVTWVNPTLNLQYLIPIFDKFYAYPLVGVGLMSVASDSFDTQSMVCFKGGAGCEYYITEQIKGLFEAYYQFAKKDGIKYSDRPLISIGAAYCF